MEFRADGGRSRISRGVGNRVRTTGMPRTDAVKPPVAIFAGSFFGGREGFAQLDDAIAKHEEDAVGVEAGVAESADVREYETNSFA